MNISMFSLCLLIFFHLIHSKIFIEWLLCARNELDHVIEDHNQSRKKDRGLNKNINVQSLSTYFYLGAYY